MTAEEFLAKADDALMAHHYRTRIAELEREVDTLRTDNRWLKEDLERVRYERDLAESRLMGGAGWSSAS